MSTTSWVVCGAEEIAVPSGAVPTKLIDEWSLARADELGVKSVVGRDEELESLLPALHVLVSRGGDETEQLLKGVR